MIVPACAVVTSPVDGRVRGVEPAGTRVRGGQVVARVEGRAGTTDLLAPVAGEVGGNLADLEQPVLAGEGIVWLSRR